MQAGASSSSREGERRAASVGHGASSPTLEANRTEPPGDVDEPEAVNARLLVASLQRNAVRWATDPQLIATRPETMPAGPERQPLCDYLGALFKHFGSRPCLATRAGEGAPYTAVTYSQVWARVLRVMVGMRAVGLVPCSHIGLFGFPSAEWVVSYLACLILGATVIPLQTNMNREDLTYVAQHGELGAVFAQAAVLPQLLRVLEQVPSVRAVVIIDEQSEAARESGSTQQPPKLSGVRFVPLSELEGLAATAIVCTEGGVPLGQTEVKQPEVKQAEMSDPGAATTESSSSPSSADPLALILFTSGSTGRPKGAMFPSTLWRAVATKPRPVQWATVPMVTTLFNLNHISGLYNLHGALNAGGTVHFLRRHDMSTFFDDVQAIRPTYMFLVPRLMELVHEYFEIECMRRAVADSLGGKSPVSAADPALRSRVMAGMRSTFLGDRLAMVMVGSAVVLPETIAFMQQCFEVPVYDFYGATESLHIARDGHIDHDVIEDFKLVDAPALGYTRADKPYPRGELYVKSRWLIPGYYRNEVATAKLRDADGFLATGDIVEQRGPDRVAYIDRAHNVLKLAQGEFVATAKIETIYTSNGVHVAQMFVYGRSDRAYLLAVVVPHMHSVQAQLGADASPESVKSLLLSEMQSVAAAMHLAGWEMPRDILVETEPFTKVNGLLTDSDKLSRPHLLAKYQPRLMQLFADIERRSHQAQPMQQVAAGPLSASDLVAGAIAAVLGREIGPDEQSQQLSFVHMGGDSLTATRLLQVLKQTCGVAPSVALVLDGNTSVAALVQYMEAALSQRQQAAVRWRPPFSQVHGEAPSVVRAADLALTHFFDEDTMQQARELPLRPQPAHVLLTGANGFLGRFLLLELLQHGKRGGCDTSVPLSVTVIVRAQDNAAALERLRAAYGQLAPLFESLTADGRLQVLAGDLMRPLFGLSDEVYDGMCSRVDTVVHNGALVNHSFSYEDLWEPNVLGTAEVMRFAIRRQRKPLTFVSTVAVTTGANRAGQDGPVLESQTGAQLWPERRVTAEYAAGYADSKWACEVLLQQVAEQAALPVAVVRSSMVLAHPDDARCPGQVNKTDFLTRLFAGVVHTAVRPPSFYNGGGDAESGEAQGSNSSSAVSTRPHFDGVPVSVSSAGMAAVALSTRTPGLHGFHAINAHYEDGVSLDSFMDWIGSSGYELHTVRPYHRWFDEFSQRLAKVEPRELRDATTYPILFQWTRPIDASAECRLDNRRFCDALRNHTEYDGVPVLDEKFLHVYIKHMQVVGLLPPPPPNDNKP